MTQEKSIVKSPRGRPSRAPVGTGSRLGVKGKDPAYEYRIVNDTSDRIQEFLSNGWELCEAKEIRVGDRRVDSPSSEGSKAQVSVGGGTKAYVMRIPKEWHAEDQAAKETRLRELEGTMKQQALQGNYGKIDLSRD